MAKRKAWTKAKKAQAMAAFASARDRVGLGHYSYDLVFSEEVGPIDVVGMVETVAEVESTENYTMAQFTLYSGFARLSQRDMFRCAVHEWLHVVLEPLEKHALQSVSPSTASLYERDRERVVEHLTKVVTYGW